MESPPQVAMPVNDLNRWMQRVAEARLDGWLVADFRWNNPLFARLLGLQSGILTRRAFLWLPAEGQGEPLVIASRIDGHAVSGLDCPLGLYAGFEEMATLLQTALPRAGRVAMEYSEGGKLPTISRVDAGLVELIRSFGVSVESSGHLIASFDIWDESQRAIHERAARGVDAARRLAFDRCAQWLQAGERVTEGRLTELIRESFAGAGLTPGDGPDVAVNAHAADPHYSLGGGEGAEIGRDDVVLIDLWARVDGVDDAPYADSTWMAHIGEQPSEELLRVFDAVRMARDAAIDAINEATRRGETIAGNAVDRVARATIETAGLADYLVHRTGHSLGADHIHGMGTNLDDIEFPDDRPLLPYSGFTVEPGLYFPGRFGVRLEVSAVLLPEGVQVTTELQETLTLL